jgi:predicted amidohydrolase YtcJ
MKQKKSFLAALTLFILLAAGMILAGGAQKPEPADLVLVGGKIVTVDEAKPQAEALAVRGDRIVAVGTSEEIKVHIGDKTRVIDLGGKLAVPGLIDSHLHFMGIGESKQSLDLTTARSWEEIVALVGEAVKHARPGQWIIGRGWHQEKWDRTPEPSVEGLPTHHSLSRVSPDNPVILEHASGHSTIANAKAMELAGISAQTPNPKGGEIIKDKNGEPIGTFLETAQRLIDRAREAALQGRTAEQVEADNRLTASLASQECLSKGLTSVHDAGISFAMIDFYKKLVDEGRLGVRVNAMIVEKNRQLQERIKNYFITDAPRHELTVRSIKRFIDGALGSHGAWLLEPYTDLPSSTGLNTDPPADLKETARIAIENGFQLCTHAIGDRANREILNIYEEAFKAHPDKKDLRWRIEHAQHLNLADIPRFGALGIIASMQGIHATSDGPWVPKRLGQQRAGEGAYVWRKLAASGALIANGTDAPVEDVNPIPGFYALVTRKMKNGQAFFGDQRMTRKEALRAYTLNGAYASFEEGIKGSLTPGKLADITVLSQDIMTVPEEEILKTQVVMTIVGGKILYKK